MYPPHAHHPHGGFGGIPPHAAPREVPIQPKAKSFFLDWVNEQKLMKEMPLSQLAKLDNNKADSPIVIGVDGSHLIHLLQVEANTKESLFFLAGAIPFGAHDFLENFICGFENAKIKPVVIFDGMNIAEVAPKVQTPDWTKVVDITNPKQPLPPIVKGRATPPPATDAKFSPLGNMLPAEADVLRRRVEACCLQNDEDFVNWVIHWLLKRGVDVIRAPYWAMAQLSSFLHKSNRFLSEVFGTPDLLIFDNVQRMLTEINFETGTAKYIEKASVLQAISEKCNISKDDIELDVLLMLDSTHRFYSTFMLSLATKPFLTLCRELLSGGEKPSFAVLHAPRLVPTYSTTKNALVCTWAGEVLPINKVGLVDKTPNNQLQHLKLSFGSRLPKVFYFFLLSSLLSPKTIQPVVNGRITDALMLVETKEGKIAIERILPLRTQIAFQIVQQLSTNDNQFFQNDFALTWIRNSSEVPILRPPQIKLDEWSGIKEADPGDFISVLDYAVNATRDAKYKTVQQALAAVHLKSLDLLGYFTHATHTNTSEVSGKSVYSEALGLCQGYCADHAVLLIELLRTRSLTDGDFLLPGMPTAPGPASAPVQSGTRFFSRLVSLIPVGMKKAYSGPTHVGLLAFNGIVRHLHRTLRSLTEVVSVNLYMEGRVQFPKGLYDFHKFPLNLPFKQPPGIIAGIIGWFIIQGPADPEQNRLWRELSSPGRRYEYLASVFPDVQDIKQTVSDIFAFWDIGVLMLQQLSRDDTPTVDNSIIVLANTFHENVVIPTALKYDISMSRRSDDVNA